jgi:PIN domain nuclease of toxin-antitoxin system
VSRINIIDASAALAFLQQETGFEVVDGALASAPSCITTVNYCEVLSKLLERGMPQGEALATVKDLRLELIDFGQALAEEAAAMRSRTMRIGASIGDRACLALAQQYQAQGDAHVYTAEQSWVKLKWPFKIVLIRGGKS